MIGRREFITAIGGAAAWSLAASSQRTAIPVIGYLNFGSPDSDAPRLTGLRRGLNQAGYVEGRNFVIEYRWAGNQANRLSAHARANVRLVNSSSQSLDSHHRPVAERPVGLVPS